MQSIIQQKFKFLKLPRKKQLTFYPFSTITTNKNTDNFKEKFCQGCKMKQIDSKIICGICNTIHNPLDFIRHNNYFELFNLNQKFSIDKSFLEKKYKEIQKVIHPDKFAQRDSATLNQAHDASSLVVHAYNILKDDYKRANYLLDLKGIGSINENNATIKDKNFLMRFMDIQERIDDAESKEELMEIKVEIDQEIKNLTNELDNNFENEQLEKALGILSSIKFNLSLLENINNKI